MGPGSGLVPGPKLKRDWDRDQSSGLEMIGNGNGPNHRDQKWPEPVQVPAPWRSLPPAPLWHSLGVLGPCLAVLMDAQWFHLTTFPSYNSIEWKQETKPTSIDLPAQRTKHTVTDHNLGTKLTFVLVVNRIYLRKHDDILRSPTESGTYRDWFPKLRENWTVCSIELIVSPLVF